ncbi:DUF2306 domain-containing protein [Paenibacillus aestuarii]|uniref:DUF2306 domain-containing protein n=1 Tax=Paenibacillus aestuarii TaxID=516965 RepID=A0ABW0KE75_9BACL|nr:DUF2306 domain-containing protein [Paenibacillus aestuarii]
MGKKIVRALVVVFALAVAFYAIVQYGLFRADQAGLVAFKLQKPDFHLAPWVYVLYAHIVTAVLALVIGPIQLFRKPTGTRVKRHRLLGYLYVAAITVSGLVSVYLALYATGGWLASLGFLGLDACWLASTWVALRKIMLKDVAAHKAWMLRSYALTFAAVTLRVWLAPLVMAFGDFETGYRLVAWLCWIPNLLVIEAVIRSRKANQRPPAASA